MGFVQAFGTEYEEILHGINSQTAILWYNGHGVYYCFLKSS